MATQNDITGDFLISRGLSEEGQKQFDIIFGVKKKERWIPPPLPTDDEWPEDRIDVIGSNGNIGYSLDE